MTDESPGISILILILILNEEWNIDADEWMTARTSCMNSGRRKGLSKSPGR